jgi:hypothetical protein
LRASEVLVYEASTGIKANIQRFYNSIPANRIDRQPAERVRMYGLLAWLNAVIQERLRFFILDEHFIFFIAFYLDILQLGLQKSMNLLKQMLTFLLMSLINGLTMLLGSGHTLTHLMFHGRH